MTQRKWYRKKRIWVLFLTVFYLITIRQEWAKFRYAPNELRQNLIEKGQTDVGFHSIESDGKTMHYIQVGKKEEVPLIVFVHGSPGSLSAFEPYLSDTSLSKIANLISVDRLGFGYSDFGKAEGSLAIQAGMLAEVLKSSKNTKTILIGHSMACPVIVKLAMDFPSLADALLMVAPPISPELEPSNTLGKVLDFPLIRWLTPPALRVCNQEIIPLKGELEGILEDWKKVEIPITIIQGDEDTLVPMENAEFAKKMLSKNKEVRIKMMRGKDHFILWSEVLFITEEIKKLL